MRLVLMGPPGAGKGTQGELLTELFRIPHIATGQIIREEIANGSPLGKKVKELIAGGDFVPDDVIFEIVCHRLEQPQAQNGYLLDGFPRDLQQAQAFTKTECGKLLDKAVALELDGATIVERLSGRSFCPVCDETYHVRFRPPKVTGKCDRDGADLRVRSDDNPESVAHRIDVYRESTEPLINYYRGRGQLIEIDAHGKPGEVFDRVVAALGACGA